MPLRSVSVSVQDFISKPITDAVLTVSLDKDAVRAKADPADPYSIITANEKRTFLLGETGQRTIQLDDSNDLDPLDGSGVRPKYIVTLSAGGWGGVGFTGANAKYLTSDITFADWLLEGTGTITPVTPTASDYIASVDINNSGFIVITLHDGSQIVGTHAIRGTRLAQNVVYSNANPLYPRLTGVMRDDRPILLGEQVVFNIPMDIDRNMNGLQIVFDRFLGTAIKLVDVNDEAVAPGQLTPGRIYVGIRLLDGQNRIRLLEDLTDRPLDYLIYVATSDDDVLEAAEIAAAQVSDGMSEIVESGPDTGFKFIGVPVDTPSITGFYLGELSTFNQINALRPASEEIIMNAPNGESYKWRSTWAAQRGGREYRVTQTSDGLPLGT